MEQDTSMDQAANIIPAQAPKRKRKSKVWLLDSAKSEHERDEVMAKTESEHENLNLHVSLCEQRYKQLEARLEALDERLSALEAKVSAFKSEMLTGFSDIKILIERQNNSRSTQMIASAGAVIVALLGVIGYILAR